MDGRRRKVWLLIGLVVFASACANGDEAAGPDVSSGAGAATAQPSTAAPAVADARSTPTESTSTAVTTDEADVPAGAGPPSSSPTTTPQVPSREVEPSAIIAVAPEVSGGVVTDDAVWAAVGGEDVLYRIDPSSDSVVQQLSAPGLDFRFDVGHGAAWVSDFDADVVRRIDVTSGAVLAEIPTGLNPEGVVVTGDAVWVADHRGGTVTRIDPTTNQVMATIEVGPVGQSGPQGITAAGDRVWVGVPNAGQVVGIDTATNAVVARADAAATCGEIGVIDDTVWISNCFESPLVEVVDAAAGVSRGSIDPGDIAGTQMQIGDLVWVSTITMQPDAPGRFVGIDPETLQIVASVATHHGAYIAGQGFGSVWQFSSDAGAVIRLPLDAFAT